MAAKILPFRKPNSNPEPKPDVIAECARYLESLELPDFFAVVSELERELRYDGRYESRPGRQS
jgi:hypothetical protein